MTTVSPTYADEIQRPEYGYGLDGVIRARGDAVTGILNGIDPSRLESARRFVSAGAVRRRINWTAKPPPSARCSRRSTFRSPTTSSRDRSSACLAHGRPERSRPHRRVTGDLLMLDATFVIVGTGDARYQEMWRATRAVASRSRAGVRRFDERRAHLVEGGADMFMMPSRFEPCGLNQMYSLRYGTVPVVRAVGGLVDTVRPYNPRNGQGNGFCFRTYRGALLQALRNARDAFGNKKIWTRSRRTA